MSDFNITIPGGESKKLKTGGKYCPADIVVTAEGVQLPTLNNPATAEDLAEGKELLDGEGKVITGTYTPPRISVVNGVLTIR